MVSTEITSRLAMKAMPKQISPTSMRRSFSEPPVTLIIPTKAATIPSTSEKTSGALID